MQDSQNSLQTFEEHVISPLNGFLGIFLLFILFALAVYFGVDSFAAAPHGELMTQYGQPASEPLLGPWTLRAIAIVLGLSFFYSLTGFLTLAPNEAVALTMFGKYKGVVKKNGFFWLNPFYEQSKISLRHNNFLSPTLKVNDSNGAPIEIACAIQWRVRDIGQAVFGVDDLPAFLQVNAEATLRAIASGHPYDVAQQDDELEAALAKKGSAAIIATPDPVTDEAQRRAAAVRAQSARPIQPPSNLSLRGHLDEISELLTADLQKRLAPTGVLIENTSITHLAYAPEIASSMLRRQQAQAIMQARKLIARGAAVIAEDTVNSLAEKVEFTPEQKARVISNLLIVLCSDKEAAPVINLQ